MYGGVPMGLTNIQYYSYQYANPLSYANLPTALAVEGGGIEYYLPYGVYSIPSASMVPSNCKIRGSGPSTVLSIPASAPANGHALYMSGVNNVTISDLSIVGNYASQIHSQDGVCIDSACSDIRLENIYVYNMSRNGFNFGTTTNPSQRIWMKNCRAFNNQYDNMLITSASDVLVDGLEAGNGVNANVEIVPPAGTSTINNIRFNNLHGVGSTGNGVNVLCQNNTTQGGITFRDATLSGNANGFNIGMGRNIKVIGGEVYNNTGYGYGIGSGGGLLNASIIGMTARSNGGVGINLVSASTANQSQGFSVADCFVYDNVGAGISLGGNGTLNLKYATLTNNECYDDGAATQTYGILSSATTVGCIVNNNVMWGNVTSDLSVAGDTTAHNNWYTGAFHA